MKLRAASHDDGEREVVSRPEWERARDTLICTNVAEWMRLELGEGKVVGYHADDNPTAKAGYSEGGHDFLLLDDSIVDVWLSDTWNGPMITRLDDPEAVREWYGDPRTWVEV